MSEYTKALTDLVAVPAHLDAKLARSEQEAAAERQRREERIKAYATEHKEILARLEATLARARTEGIANWPDEQGKRSARLGADPLEQAAQLVGRLDEALRETLYTRAALEAEEATLSEAERKRAAEERRRREREALRRGEAWERARQGTAGLMLALAGAAVAGGIAGTISTGAVVIAALLVALACAGLFAVVSSTLPVLAVRRATGSTPPSSTAPAREARLAGLAYAGTGLAATGLGALIASLASGNTPLPAAAVTAVGVAITVSIYWLILPRVK
jgi:hypothetical protein